MTGVTRAFTPEVTFRSPTGNLACFLRVGGLAICRARSHTWTSGAPDPGCRVKSEATSGVELSSSGAQERSDCYDLVPAPQTVLPYGHGFELDGVRCISRQSGITCRRSSDRAGFSISGSELSKQPTSDPLLDGAATSLDRGATTVFPKGFEISFVVGELASCVVNASRVSCLVRTGARQPPKAPHCDFDQALTAVLPPDRRGELVNECRSDANPGVDELRAGKAVQVGDLRCATTSRRLRCEHLTSARHGFEVDASHFRGF